MYEQLHNKTTSVYNVVKIGNYPAITVKERVLTSAAGIYSCLG